MLTDRLADPKTIVNVAESAFQILAPQPSQSVPSILSRPAFVAKPNSPCSSEVPGSWAACTTITVKAFLPESKLRGETHKKRKRSRTITSFFVSSIGKEEQTLGNNTFLLLIYIIPR